MDFLIELFISIIIFLLDLFFALASDGSMDKKSRKMFITIITITGFIFGGLLIYSAIVVTDVIGKIFLVLFGLASMLLPIKIWIKFFKDSKKGKIEIKRNEFE